MRTSYVMILSEEGVKTTIWKNLRFTLKESIIPYIKYVKPPTFITQSYKELFRNSLRNDSLVFSSQNIILN